MMRLSAALLLLALPASAQVQTPAAGYTGVDVPRALQAAQEVRTQAERARDRKVQQALSRIAPAAGGDEMRPHILQIGARHRSHNLADAKHPVPAQPASGRGLVPFSITTVQKELYQQQFDDRPACEASARWWLENVLDPETDAVACLPRGTRR